jgi:DedD protein
MIDYWVQTGSFSTQVRAENAKTALAARGMASTISNVTVSGGSYFRVRVGPYTSQSEAIYWLNLIKAMDGFSDSRVMETPRN